VLFRSSPFYAAGIKAHTHQHPKEKNTMIGLPDSLALAVDTTSANLPVSDPHLESAVVSSDMDGDEISELSQYCDEFPLWDPDPSF
jgi:hypothetical protein